MDPRGRAPGGRMRCVKMQSHPGAMRWKSVLFLFLCPTAVLVGCVEAEGNTLFSEDLFLRPLSDGKILSHFYFKNTLPVLGTAAHHHGFPKAISQLVQKFHIREMELSFTQGRWNYERWGALDPIASSNAKPSGVELSAAFDVPLDQVDAIWRNLTHALSGLFCASINFLESPAMVAAPEFAFGSNFGATHRDKRYQFPKTETKGNQEPGWLRYGALPREAVCTENLTPWLKLLPCRDKAGIAALLSRSSIYRGHYHSLRMRVYRGDPVSGSGTDATVLEQTLTLVLQPSHERERSSGKDLPSWSLFSAFGRRLEGSCPIAKTSHVLLELEWSLVQKAHAIDSGKDGAGLPVKISTDTNAQVTKEINLIDNDVFRLSVHPDSVYQEESDIESEGHGSHPPSLLLDYQLRPNHGASSFNIGMTWKKQISWPSIRSPFRVTRFLIGSGNQKGSIMIELKSNYDHMQRRQELIVDDLVDATQQRGANGSVDVTIFHMVPWYVRLYSHTLTVLADGEEVPLWEVAKQMRILPAEDRLSPAVLEMQLQLPANISILSLTVEFDKGFLHMDEHPPDANHGFDLPAALVAFPTSQTRRIYRISQSTFMDNVSPFLQTLQDAGPVRIYTETLLVPLATPDFSMPYHVITFTCTVLALYFGSLLNTLRRRIGEEERRLANTRDSRGKLSQLISRYMEGKSETQKKLTKLFGTVVVVVIAIVGNKFLN